MAETVNENDSSVQIRSRGEAKETTNAVNDNQAQAQQNQNEAPQQQEGSPWKSMIVRMVIFWLVINFFRSKGPSSPATNPESEKGVNSGPCFNLFRDGQFMVRHCL